MRSKATKIARFRPALRSLCLGPAARVARIRGHDDQRHRADAGDLRRLREHGRQGSVFVACAAGARRVHVQWADAEDGAQQPDPGEAGRRTSGQEQRVEDRRVVRERGEGIGRLRVDEDEACYLGGVNPREDAQVRTA